MRRPRILILSFSPLATDPRVNRQIDLLAPDYEVVAAGFSAPINPQVTYVALPSARKPFSQRLFSALSLLCRRHHRYYWSIDSVTAANTALKHQQFDIIIANDADTWPLACALADGTGARLLFDAHEYAPLEFEDIWWWRLLYAPYRHHLCRTWFPRAHGHLTVCHGIAEEYDRVYGVRPIVLRNMPGGGSSASPSTVRPNAIRLIHHGMASPSRNIEVMIELMNYLDDRFSLDLILVGSTNSYLTKIHRLAALNRRIRFTPPVPTDQIVAATRDYDVGLFLLPPVNFNYRHALPNKFFEFVQARLAIAIGPSPEMARLTREHDLGIVAKDFSARSLADALNALTPASLATYKANSHRAAPLLSWDHEREILRQEVERLLHKQRCAE